MTFRRERRNARKPASGSRPAVRAGPARATLAGLTALACLGDPSGAAAQSTQSRGGTAGSSSPLVVRNVNVVDVRRGVLLRDRTVVFADGLIRAVLPGDRAVPSPPAGGAVVDGSGRFLVPGLWDMHAHVLPTAGGAGDWWEPDPRHAARLLLANGVTGVRAMWGTLEAAEAWRSRDGPVPRLLAPGGIIDGPFPWFPGLLSVVSASDARRLVDSLATGGADFIKVYNALPPDLLPVIVDRARTHGLPVSGHVPNAMSALDAARAGMASFEHLHGVLEGCSEDEAWLLRDNVAYLDDRAAGRVHEEGNLDYFTRLLETQSDERCDRLVDRLARLGVAQTPTLVAHRGPLRLRDPDAADDPRLAFVPEEAARFWQPGTYEATRGFGGDDWRLAERRLHRIADVVRRMHEAGLPILAGSDVHPTLAFTFPGFSLHEELQLLVEAGLSPADVLRSATLTPATVLGTADRRGEIRPGREADAVLLRENPLSDIRHTRTIEAVIRGGRWLPRDTLDAWLADVARAYRVPAPPALPELPADAASVVESRRRAEFRYVFLAEPEHVTRSLPTFARPLRARDAAAVDPALDAFLRVNPQFDDWAVAGFEIGSYEGDGRSTAARWWVAIRDAGLTEPGSHPLGGTVVEMDRWRSRGPGAASVEARRYGSGTWSFHVEALELDVDVVCRPGGARWHETSLRSSLIYPGERIPDRYFRSVESGETRRDCETQLSADGLSPLAATLRDAPYVAGFVLGARLVEGGVLRRATYVTY